MAALKQLKRGRKRIWRCKEGCKLTNIPCPHLEALINDKQVKNVPISYNTKIENINYDSGIDYIIPKEIRDRTWEMQFREKLTKTGLEAIKIDIVVCRFFYEMSLAEIAKELEIVSASTVLRLLSDSLKYLKKNLKKKVFE